MANVMTSKAFYQAVINANISAEVTAKAELLLDAVVKKNSNSKTKSAENRKANLALAETIASVMEQGKTYGASELIKLSGLDISGSKCTAVMKVGFEEGLFTKIDKYKAEGAKSTCIGYSLAE